MARNTLMLFHQQAPETRRPWVIAEQFWSIDGPRIRITHKHFATETEAREFIEAQDANP